jgi:homoserine dehydrogenase
MTAKPVGVGLLGAGTVGGAVGRAFAGRSKRIDAAAGRTVRLLGAAVRDPKKTRDAGDVPLTADPFEILDDPDIGIVIEVIGGHQPAFDLLLAAFERGKHVVTANKEAVAKEWDPLHEAARLAHRELRFEAAVGGAVPVVRGVIEQGAVRPRVLRGLLNGTTTYICSRLESGIAFEDALAEAQAKGYAEADPTLDVDGTDAAHKLAILAQIAFGAAVPLPSIPRRGIAGIDQADIRFARELGYTIKLLAEAFLDPAAGPDEAGGQLALHVAPVMLRHTRPLALVRDAYNAITVVGDAVGTTLYYGRGAGQMPTASAVVADIIDLAVGRAQQTFRTLRLWSGHNREIRLRAPATVPSRYYLRLMVRDRPGALAEVTRALANHKISISSVIQHEAFDGPEGEVVPLIIMTHTATTGSFEATLAEIDRLECVTAPGVYYHVGD